MDSSGAAAVSGLLTRLGLPLTLLSPLLGHASAVASASPRLGLVSTGDEAVVPERHTADSLIVAAACPPRPGEHWADLGSGGGFPGLPLAICYPETRFTLIEASKKKAGFLEMQLLDLGLQNAEVLASRAAEVGDERFDVAVCRAIAEPEQAMKVLSFLVRAGGTCLVAAAHPIPGARVVRVEAPEVDSPCSVSMMTKE